MAPGFIYRRPGGTSLRPFRLSTRYGVESTLRGPYDSGCGRHRRRRSRPPAPAGFRATPPPRPRSAYWTTMLKCNCSNQSREVRHVSNPSRIARAACRWACRPGSRNRAGGFPGRNHRAQVDAERTEPRSAIRLVGLRLPGSGVERVFPAKDIPQGLHGRRHAQRTAAVLWRGRVGSRRHSTQVFPAAGPRGSRPGIAGQQVSELFLDVVARPFRPGERGPGLGFQHGESHRQTNARDTLGPARQGRPRLGDPRTEAGGG